MEGNQQDKNQNRNAEQCRRAVRSPIVRMLAFVVAFCTVFSLIPPTAIMAAPEQTLDCPLVIHQHDATCYDADNTLICGMADFVVHTHDDNCYDADASLVCTLEEIRVHEHSAECFTTEQNLICELAEDETHTHGDGCYESVQTLTCAEEEIILHTHSDSCQDENGDLTCGMLEVVEHVHGDGCFTTAAEDTTPTTEPTVETTAETTTETTVEATTETTEATVPQETTTETTKATESTEVTEAPIAPIAAEVVASGACGESVNWVLTDDGVLTISGSGNMTDYDPEGEPPAWFDNSSLITSVIIEDSVTSVDDCAFVGCDSLVKIEVGTNNQQYCSIDGVLYSKDQTKLLCYPAGKIDPLEVTIPDGVTSIGNFAFAICYNLTSITIPDSVTSIGDYAFAYCENLTSITIPDGVTSIGDTAFVDCYNLASVTLGNGITSIGNFAFYNCSNLTSITIPKGVTSIGDYTFYHCSNLTSITLPEGVTTIGEYAFYACYDLTSITIPEGVTSIGNFAFYNCSNLTSITIPKGVTSIGDYTFYDCRNLTSITLPEGVTTIGEYAFYSCYDLTNITIPGSVTSIGNSAFEYCRGLTDIAFGNGIASVGSNAFSACSGLESISFEKSVSTIDFEILDTLREYSEIITFKGPNYFTYTGNDCVWDKLTFTAGDYYLDEYGEFYRLNSDGTATLVYCPEDLIAEQHEILSAISSEDDSLTYTVTAIGDSALKGCSGLKAITIPDSVTAIGHQAFQNCSGLTQITLPSGISSLGNLAFCSCKNLASVNGETDLFAVIQTWASAGANTSTFLDTALFGESATITTTDIVIEDDTGRKIRISTNDTQALTGEAVQTILTIDKGNEDSNSVVRVYFQFASEYGSLNYPVGSYTFEGIPVAVCETSIPYTYYIEVSPLLAGQTLNLTLTSVYENIISSGGPALIWVDALPADDATVLGNGVTEPGLVHKVIWTTQADTFPVTKKAATTSVTLKGDGETVNEIPLKGLSYTITMNRSGNTSSYGKDPIVSVDFVDTLSLPEHFRWREGLLEAIRANNWYVSIYGNSISYYVTIDQNSYHLATLESDTLIFDANGTKLAVDDAGNVQICWTCRNPDITTEMYSIRVDVSFGDNVILSDTEGLAQAVEETGSSVTCAFDNKVTATQYFCYSECQYQEATATKNISVGAASYSISKSSATDSSRMGEDEKFYVYLKNEGSLPYTALDYVTDPLPDYFYITPADMETMFFRDSHGKELSITITHATLCTPISHTVTGIDGQSYVINQQYEGVNTPHEGKAPVGSDESIIASDETLTICWSEDQVNLELIVGEEHYSIGAGCTYSGIQEALDGIGYIVTSTARYTCRWDQVGKTLYSGEKRTFAIHSTAKDSFMRLIGDQDWFIIDDKVYMSSVWNYAYAYSIDGSSKSDNKRMTIYRDFTLFKEAYLDGGLVDESTSIEAGAILTYKTDVTKVSHNTYEALPLVDHMEGAQILLVSVADNPNLADKGLETMEVGGESCYILNKVGQYKNVKVGTLLADRVEIQLTDTGLDTMIYWYLTDIWGNTTITAEYLALVSPKLAGVAIDGVSYYTLSNEVWLNDHQTHRLYDQCFTYGSVLNIDKNIVTNIPETESGDLTGHDPSKDELAKRSTIRMGQTVIYRLMLENTSNGTYTILGSSMFDTLPASINDYWNENNITVTYVPAEGASVQIDNGDSWRIETDANAPAQQYLRWNDDFSATIRGTLYIYVTLTFPTDTQWSDYCHTYGSMDLVNAFQVDQLREEVFHDLAVPAEILLQKGVYQTSTVTSFGSIGRELHNSQEDSLWYYTNNANFYGVVTYYVTLYNSGNSRVYLSDIQDVLPEGFTYLGLYSTQGCEYASSKSSNTNYRTSMISVSGVNQSNVTFKHASIESSRSINANGRQVVTFSLCNANGLGNLQYDADLGKYYLNSGEAVVFAYYCQTNSYSKTKDVASNVVSMPYYDHNGAGMSLDTTTAVDRAKTNYMRSNNGNRFLATTGQAALWGMDTSGYDHSTRWLSSEVTLYRGSILPGITKTAARSFAHVTDSINWSVRVDNSGKDNMRDYTLTDVMMAPYQFTGTVSYGLSYGNHTNIYLESPNLFAFGQRTPGDNKVTITSDIGNTVELIVNGGYQYIRAYMYCYDNGRKVGTGIVTVAVRLSRDTNGSEVLSVFFPEDATYIPPNGYAMLTLKTQNFGTAYKNTSFFNTAYITPSEDQPFDTGAISQGNYTIYNEADSVVSEANVAVSFGYATTSFTGVSELSNPSNSASSIGSTDHIVLSDAASPFRYALTVNNTGGTATSQAMDSLVLIDNLPQIGDHVTFYQEISRFSEFQVNFEEDPAFAVSVDGAVLDPGSYTLQFSKATEFGDGDWRGTGTDGWYTLEQIDADAALSLKDMRSFRVVIRDDTGTVIPTEAQITVSFNAEVDLSKGDIPPAATAWNSFGYHYSLVDDDTELEASPQKVGIRMSSIPCLAKELQDKDGVSYPASEDTSFRFVVYEGTAITLPNVYTQEDVFSALANSTFTVVELTVKAGQSTSQAIALDGLHCYRYENGSLVETDTPWVWKKLTRYTLLELPLSNDSIYQFGSFNKTQPNNYTFAYDASVAQLFTCVNICQLWNIQIEKQCAVTETALSGAIFGLYSPSAEDLISDEKLSEQTAQLQNMPQKVLEVDNITWYLMDIQVADENGQILWNDLVEDQYYLLELQAPDGYVLNEQPGQVIRSTAAETVYATVTNAPEYNLPLTGGSGVTGFYASGAALTGFSLLMGYRKKRRSKEKRES